MPDPIPEEAFREGLAAYECAWVAGVTNPAELVRITLEAAAPILAAQVRRETAVKQLERVARMVSWGAVDSWTSAHGLPIDADPMAVLRAVERWCRDAARQIGQADDAR